MKVTFFLTLLGLVALHHVGADFSLPVDCDDIYRKDNTSSSGVYTIFPGGPTSPLHVHCDMDTDGGRWTVFQRRMDGSQNFYRPWNDYKSGFGNVAGEYWLGLENIFLLSMRKKNELRVDMEDWEGFQASAQYSSFSIDSEYSGYQLHLGSFSGGAAEDSLASHNLMKFTTYDKDQDPWKNNCAHYYLGGFWYNECHTANPNGMYTTNGAIAHASSFLMWNSWRGAQSLKTFTMKMRSTAKCQCTD